VSVGPKAGARSDADSGTCDDRGPEDGTHSGTSTRVADATAAIWFPRLYRVQAASPTAPESCGQAGAETTSQAAATNAEARYPR
jgi:hypothetical protein